jgi:hypothetical protein
MPEQPICIHCRKPITKEFDDYIVTNKDQEWKESKWLYAHVECHKKSS